MPYPAKSIDHPGQGCRFGRCAGTAVKLTSGDLHRVLTGLGDSQGSVTAVQKSAEGVVGDGHEPVNRKPHRTEGPNGPREGINGVATRPYDS